MTQKKVLHRVGIILDNPGFTNASLGTLSRVTKSNLFIFPYWKGEKRDASDI
jgi:hypothetical protein